jgi:hypothetical protein
MRTIDIDWFGVPAPDGRRWKLRVAEGHLLFQAAAVGQPTCTTAGAAGAFVAGLWEGDVAEMFLANPKTGYYLEYNLAPGGAWWCCAFDAPRRRVASLPAPPLGVCGSAANEGGTDAWESTLTIPLASLPSELEFDPASTRGNITFCLGRPQRFFTLADLGGGQPDFHRPSRWLPLDSIMGSGFSNDAAAGQDLK